jgi:hypothetical protein
MAKTPKIIKKQVSGPAFFMSIYLHKPLLVPLLSASFITIFTV